MICHCDACNYNFNGAVVRSKYDIPCKCPNCGKRRVAKYVPAVRAATEEEIADLEREMKEMWETVSALLVK